MRARSGVQTGAEQGEREPPRGARPRGGVSPRPPGRDPRRRRGELSRAGRRDGRPRGRVGFREVGDLAGDHGDPAEAGAGGGRTDPVSRPGCGCRRGQRCARGGYRRSRPRGRRPSCAARRAHLDDLPGADDLALSPAHGRRPDRGGGAPAPGRRPRRRARGGPGDARTGGFPRPREGPRRLSLRALGGVAAAGDDRDGPGLPPRPADRGRAYHRPRRHHPGADPQAHPGSQGRARHGGAADHARSRSGREHGRRGGRRLPRPGHGKRPAPGHLRAAPASLPQGPDARGAAHRHDGGRASEAAAGGAETEGRPPRPGRGGALRLRGGSPAAGEPREQALHRPGLGSVGRAKAPCAAGSRRGQPQHRTGRVCGAGGGERLRQDDLLEDPHPRAPARLRRGEISQRGRRGLPARSRGPGAHPLPAQDAVCVPGSGERAEPPHDGVRHRERAPRHPPDRRPVRAQRRRAGVDAPRRARPPLSRPLPPTASRAGSASASGSHARSP